jgi:hypothetical protein
MESAYNGALLRGFWRVSRPANHISERPPPVRYGNADLARSLMIQLTFECAAPGRTSYAGLASFRDHLQLRTFNALRSSRAFGTLGQAPNPWRAPRAQVAPGNAR